MILRPFRIHPKSNAFRLYRCYTTLHILSVREILRVPWGLALSAYKNFAGPGRDTSKRCFGPPSTFCDLLRDPPKSPDRRYFASRFFFGPGPHFSRFPTLRVCCDNNIINTLSLLVCHTTTSITFQYH